MTELPSGHKREARERLVHDLIRTPAAGRRRFLAGAASALVAATAGEPLASAATVAADATNLKITDLKTTILQINHQDWTTLVEVRTNQGLTGLGQTTFRATPKVLYSILENVLKPIVIGHSPFEYERLWSEMFLNNLKYGTNGALLLAISAIDFALWDLMGKAVNLPVYRLLGGKFRDKVEVYASRSERRTDDNPKAIAQRLVEDVLPAGFHALKAHTHVTSPRGYDADMDADHTVEEIAEIRRLTGPDIKIMVDVNNAYTPQQAIKVGRKLQELDAFWLEEPVELLDLQGLARVADAIDVRIAAGEQQFNRWEFYRLIVEGHVDIIQPNASICGGITEIRKIAAVASLFETAIASHNTLNGIPTTAALHFWVSTQNVRYPQEYDFNATRPDFGLRIVKHPVVAKDGYPTPPEGPGLGVELDEVEVAKLSV
ncbi:MAG: mandelate racemase/muconate lactonizing enzyme family protein [Bryobacteraceae bacterium]